LIKIHILLKITQNSQRLTSIQHPHTRKYSLRSNVLKGKHANTVDQKHVFIRDNYWATIFHPRKLQRWEYFSRMQKSLDELTRSINQLINQSINIKYLSQVIPITYVDLTLNTLTAKTDGMSPPLAHVRKHVSDYWH